MPIMDMLKDPETGKIKPAVLIGGAGIGIAGVFMLMNKGGGGVASPGQSGANTDALNGLGSAILGLAGDGGGAGAGGGSSSGAGAVVKQGSTGSTGSTVSTGLVPKVGAVSKPSNSGLSPAPKVVTHTAAPVASKPAIKPSVSTIGTIIAAGGAAVGGVVTKAPTTIHTPTAPVKHGGITVYKPPATAATSARQQDPAIPAPIKSPVPVSVSHGK